MLVLFFVFYNDLTFPFSYNALEKVTAATIGLTEFSTVELTKGNTMPLIVIFTRYTQNFHFI